MFSLHEVTKTRLCRAAFVGLCAVPTLAVLWWSVAVHLPDYRWAHEQTLAAALGLRVQLASVSAPRPGLTRYEGLELSDPETRQLLARLPMVEVEDRADSVSIRLPAAAIVNGLRLDAAWKVARDQTRRSAARRQLRLEVPSLAVQLDDADYNFTDVAGEIESTDERSQLHVRFRHATAHQARAESADVQAEATEITFVEDRDANPPSATFRFRSGTTPLPCGLAVSLWPGAEHLGNASRFAGRILAAEQAGAWQAELAGRMTGVDLNVPDCGRRPRARAVRGVRAA